MKVIEQPFWHLPYLPTLKDSATSLRQENIREDICMWHDEKVPLLWVNLGQPG